MKILILGKNGQIGSAFHSFLSQKNDVELYGTFRSKFRLQPGSTNTIKFDVLDRSASIRDILLIVRPDFVINCIGITRQLCTPINVREAVYINSYFPHVIDMLSVELGFRNIHISTDCVFRGTRGWYTEEDDPDASDLYGRSKALGESLLNSLVVRTSTIGHEHGTHHGLLEWFLSQKDHCFGYKNAFFNGFPAIELARIVYEYYLDSGYKGVINTTGELISKYDLLQIIAQVYQKSISIIPAYEPHINRSLSNRKFIAQTQYTPKPWFAYISEMKRVQDGA